MLGLAALLLVGGSAALWFRRAMQVRLPEDRTPFVVSWVVGALLAISSLVAGPGWLGGSAAVLAILAAAFLGFTVSISSQEVAADAIRVGAALPDFSATDDRGETFQRAELAGKPVLLKFFRGHW